MAGGYKMKRCEKHNKRYKTICEECMFERLDEEHEAECREQVERDLAEELGCSIDDIPQELVDIRMEGMFEITE